MNNCFFCCKILPKEEKHCVNNSDEGEQLNDFHQISTGDHNRDSDNNKLNYGLITENLLQVSHYLKLPKSAIKEVNDEGVLSTINFCQDCKQINKKLGEHCKLLEVTQMKVNYYLSLLTDKILQKDEQTNHQLTDPSSFQKTFHDKCLTKLSEVNPNPVLQLTKCDKQVYLEETDADDYKYPIVTFEEYDNKPIIFQSEEPKDPPENHTENRFNCQFCPANCNNLVNLRRHIEASHVQKKTSSGHLIKACEYCGAMLSTRNLSTHKKRVHGLVIGKPDISRYQRCSCGKVILIKNMKRHKLSCVKSKQFRDTNLNGESNGKKDSKSGKGMSVTFECSNCRRQYCRRMYLEIHIKYECKMGQVIVIENGEKPIRLENGLNLINFEAGQNLGDDNVLLQFQEDPLKI